jgi:rhodanese-related sulfurtransferase
MSVPRISKDDLKLRLDDVAGEAPVIVDARLKYPYEHSTMKLPGALRVAPEFIAASLGDGTLPRDREIVVYDSDPDDMVSERIVAQLLARGYRAVVLQGGIADWAAAKFPTDSKPAPQPASPPGAQKG